MKRQLYVVEARRKGGWLPCEGSRGVIGSRSAACAKSLAREYFGEYLFGRIDVRAAPYGPHGERVSARPLLVLRAKGGRR